MPGIQISILRSYDIEKKRKLVEKLADLMVEIFEVPREAVTISINENELENVAIGGKLALDLFKDGQK